MKKLVVILLINILALTLFSGGVAYAQEDTELPDPGITPDSPFYFADKWAKQLSLMFTFREEAKVEKALRYAKERLAEMDAMLVQNKTGAATQATNEYNNWLAITTRHMEEARKKGVDTSEYVTLAVSRHIGILNKSINGADENQQRIMTEARERARVCQETAVRTIAQGDPEKAIQTNLMLMERQLNRIRVRSEEQQATGLQEELQEFERLNNLGQEISQIAKGLGKDTTVDQLVGEATANHLRILADIYEDVPEQARTGFENAIANTLVNRERVLQALENKGSLGDIPQEVQFPEGLQERIMQRVQEHVEEGVSENLQQQIKERIQERLSNVGTAASQSISDNESGRAGQSQGGESQRP